MLKYYNFIKNQIVNIFYCIDDSSNNSFEESISIINPCEFIFSKVPGSNFSVSKLNTNTTLFYDLFEIINDINLFDDFKFDRMFVIVSSEGMIVDRSVDASRPPVQQRGHGVHPAMLPRPAVLPLWNRA